MPEWQAASSISTSTRQTWSFRPGVEQQRDIREDGVGVRRTLHVLSSRAVLGGPLTQRRLIPSTLNGAPYRRSTPFRTHIHPPPRYSARYHYLLLRLRKDSLRHPPQTTNLAPFFPVRPF